MKDCIVFPYPFSRPSLSHSNRLFRTLPFHIQKVRDKRISDSHWHDYLHIWYTVSGEYRHTLNGVTYTQKPGDAIVVFPYAIHAMDSSESDISNTEVFSLSIRKGELTKRGIPFISHTYQDAFFNSQKLSPVISLSGSAKASADNLFYDIFSEYQKKTSMNTNKVFSSVSSILELCVDKSQEAFDKSKALSLAERFQRIDNSIAFLLENISEKLTLDDLSKYAMMSKRSFSSSFLATTGHTPHSYITHLRVNEAVQLLRKTDLGIEEIATRCGFCHSSHFSQACKELCGMSPNAYRRHLSKWTREVGYPLYKQTVKEESWALTFDEASEERIWFTMSY